MNAKAQKSAVLVAKQTVKIQKLIKEFPPLFQYDKKEFYSKQALYFHRNQNGLIEISRWKFDDERKNPLVLEKLPIQIETMDSFYEYKENPIEKGEQNDEQNNEIDFYVNFSGSELFYECDSYLNSQSANMVFLHPLLLSCKKYMASFNELNGEKNDGMKPLAFENGKPTPVIFQNVPYWIFLDDESKQVVPLQKEIKSNIISMKAIEAKGKYTEEQILILLKTVLVAFSGAEKVSRMTKSKSKTCAIHTGNWGCNSYGNNKELIYLLQIIAASATGIKKIVFHKPDENLLSCAEEKFSLLLPDLPKEITLKNVVEKIFEMDFHADFGS